MRGFLIGGITLNVLLIGWFLAVAYGRYVSSYSDWRDPEEWCYCAPTDEVVLEEVK